MAVSGDFKDLSVEALVNAASSIGNLQLHPGWDVLLDFLARLEQSALERMGDCSPEELPRLQGERNAVRTLRHLLSDLPDRAERVLTEKVEDGEISDDELMRVATHGL